MSRQSDQTRNSIRRVLEDHLATVVSPDVAARIVQQARDASNGAREAAQARTASRAPGSGVARIQSAAHGQSSRGRLAAILVETATQGMASTGEAHAIAEAAYDVLGSGTHRIPLATGLGRTLLRQAAIRGVGPAVKLEASAFLALSTLPHPAWLHATCEVIGALATGGCIWMVGVLGTYLLRTEGSDRAVKVVLPTVAVVALISERPAKVFFAPRRPFGHLLHMMLLGQKPRGRSFPSGHAATSFAGAWVLGSVWPRRRGAFLVLATLVSLCRVYLGAHDPGEILAGTVLGVGLAELLRRPFDRLLAQVDLPKPPRRWNT